MNEQQYEETKARNKAFEEWINSIRGKNGWASYKKEDIPANVPRVTNEERSALEVYEFRMNAPEKYFLYIKESTYSGCGNVPPIGSEAIATTFMGDRLGTVFMGNAFRDNFGGTRVPIRILAINGRTYAGTYFKSAGSYARVKLCKG